MDTYAAHGDWKVLRYQRKPGFYKFRIAGVNFSDGGREFVWNVPDLSETRYDLSDAIDVTGLGEGAMYAGVAS
jgi:hypothetical protein